MSNKNSWEERCKKIQTRSIDNTDLEVKNSKTLWAEILKTLNSAVDDKILSTKQSEIRGLLKL